MGSLTTKNLPEHLHARLKAQRNHRSLANEAIDLLEAGLAANARVRPLPPVIKRRGCHITTIEEIEAYIADGQK